MSLRQCFGICLIVFSAGCASFQDSEYKTAQYLRAHCAWWRNGDERCSGNPVSHYSKGWRQGYADVLMGGDGTCPPVPPPCYWSHKYQNCHGERVIDDWFKGYHDGGCSAIASGRGDYHTIPMSDLYRQGGESCLPGDDSPYPPGRTTLEVKNIPLESTTEKSAKDQKVKQASDESNSGIASVSKLIPAKKVDVEWTEDSPAGEESESEVDARSVEESSDK